MKRLLILVALELAACTVVACIAHQERCIYYEDLRKPPQECKHSECGGGIKQEAPNVPIDNDGCEEPTPDGGDKPPSGDHGPKPKDDNGHGNDDDHHDSNPR